MSNVQQITLRWTQCLPWLSRFINNAVRAKENIWISQEQRQIPFKLHFQVHLFKKNIYKQSSLEMPLDNSTLTKKKNPIALIYFKTRRSRSESRQSCDRLSQVCPAGQSSDRLSMKPDLFTMSSSLFKTNSPLSILLWTIIARTLYTLYWQSYHAYERYTEFQVIQ